MKGETITQTEYVVRIVTPKGTPETNLRLGRVHADDQRGNRRGYPTGCCESAEAV